jgi:Gpi18-like mannosyltransferase
MREQLLKFLRWEPFRRAVVLWIVMRVGLSAWAVVVLLVSSPDALGEGAAGVLLGPWRRFDTMHFIRLARDRYVPGAIHSVFLPFYPTLIRFVSGVLGGQYLLAALLVSNLSTIGYLTVFYALAEREIGAENAGRAQTYAALYPWAFFLLAGYSESLFLFMVTLSFWVARRGWIRVGGLCGALAALTRLQGVTLVLPLLYEKLRARRFRLLPFSVDFLWALLPPVALGGFMLVREWAGVESVSSFYSSGWHHRLAFPWVGMVTNVRNMVAGTAHPTDYLDFLTAWLMIALTVIVWQRLSPVYALYMTIAVLFNISHLRTPHPMCSVGRHSIEVFPIFFLLGRWGRNAWLNRLILYPSIALLLYLSGQFVLGGWVG